MAQITVMINGRDYRLACDDGQEDHLRALAQKVDARVSGFRGAFGEMGDNRLTVMAALMAEDDINDLRRKLEDSETETNKLRLRQRDAQERLQQAEAQVAELLTSAAEQVERLTAGLRAG